VARGDRRHGTGVFGRWFPVVLVLAILASAGAAYRFDLGPRWFGTGEPDPDTEPAAVDPPSGVELPPLTRPAAVASPLPGAGSLSPAKVRRAVAPFLRDRDLGKSVHAVVAGISGGRPALSFGADPAKPASTTKLLTVTAALKVLGPDHVFETTVVRGGPDRIVLVGGGDPFLERRPVSVWPQGADVASLARRTAAVLDERGRTKVQVAYDDSLFTGPAENPSWRKDYVPNGIVSPITALWVDEGRDPSGSGRVADPSAEAAAEFARALERSGIRVTGRLVHQRAKAGAAELARVTGASLSQVVERVLEVSDNEGAEVLARHVGLAVSGSGSSDAGTDAVLSTLRRLGVRTDGAKVFDGSGLSRKNRIDPDTLVDVLRVAAAEDHPELRSTLTGLPVAGFTGSLAFRFSDTPVPGRGRVRAKTGTLTGVSALAGVATDLDGVPMVFALVADRIKLRNTLDAQEALDDLAAALGACHCAA
jgi:D-alanyl-D-alanine carboxypeptidase/D-alanyl-D-alanine-endopeptidase (penicillin-binding protein 4)